MAGCGTFQKLRPLSLLAHLSNCYDSANLKVSNNSVSWSIYLDQGKIVYASHSVAAFDRLDCHLRRLSHQVPIINNEIRSQLRLLFETDPESQSIPNPDYQAICWLVENQYIDSTQANLLIEGLVKEVIESFLLVQEGTYEFGNKLNNVPTFCCLPLQPIVEYCQNRLQSWQALGPQISSPYQRPYFLTRRQEQIVPEVQQKINLIQKGFSFRHLAVLLNQDEIQLAGSLHPYVVNGTVLLQEPYPPFDKLPRTVEQLPLNPVVSSPTVHKPPVPISPIAVDYTTTFPGKMYPQIQSPGISPRPLENSPHIRNNFPEVQSPEISPHPLENAPANTQQESIGVFSTDHSTVQQDEQITASTPLPHVPSAKDDNSIYTVVCVDDSQTMLNLLKKFLDDESFSVHTINNPVKALMQIKRLKPDLILLDVNMTGIDGYELCKLLRNHSSFKHTPIIMVTGNTGIIDRVKARIAGASGYLTKPFNQSELMKIIFKKLF